MSIPTELDEAAPTVFVQAGYEELIARLDAGDGTFVTFFDSGAANTCAYDVTHNGQDLAVIVRRPHHGIIPAGEVDKGLATRAYALRLHLGDAALEEVLACAPDVVVTRRMSHALDELSVSQVENIAYETLDRLAGHLALACQKPFRVDTYGPNVLLDGGEFGIIDYSAPMSRTEPAGRQFMYILRNNILDLHRQAPTKRERAAWYGVYLLGLQVLQERYQDDYRVAIDLDSRSFA